MSTETVKPENPSAFPHDEKMQDGSYWFGHPGATLRDLFAGFALAGFFAKYGDHHKGNAVRSAYDAADLMLSERERKR